MMQVDLYFEQAVAFIQRIGIPVVFQPSNPTDQFLPGLLISEGKILVDMENLKHPGDILHEAAHIAVVPAADRATLNGVDLAKRNDAPAEEMMAIAWCYAACKHLEMEPSFVFHPEGYQGGSDSIIENFTAGNYFGVPMLQWTGMTYNTCNEGPAYPAMLKWLRD